MGGDVTRGPSGIGGGGGAARATNSSRSSVQRWGRSVRGGRGRWSGVARAGGGKRRGLEFSSLDLVLYQKKEETGRLVDPGRGHRWGTTLLPLKAGTPSAGSEGVHRTVSVTFP